MISPSSKIAFPEIVTVSPIIPPTGAIIQYTESIMGSAKLVPLTIGTFISLVNNSYDQTASQFHIT